MKLQLAIDLLSVPDALALLHKVAPYVDVIELGTPLIKQEGLSVVTRWFSPPNQHRARKRAAFRSADNPEGEQCFHAERDRRY